MTAPLVITIDGPAGAGKSTVAHRLARRLGLEYLDTGAMYRAAALIAVERRIDPADGRAIADAIHESRLHFDWSTDPPRLYLGDDDVTERIRDLEVSAIVSTVACRPEVREVLVEQQRAIAKRHPRMVSEGRDQGSVVFPDARVRFFLFADSSIRARRRREQLTSLGRDVEFADVERDIEHRDRIDSTRSDAPLIRPLDAIDIDATTLEVDEVVDQMEQIVRREVVGLREGSDPKDEAR